MHSSLGGVYFHFQSFEIRGPVSLPVALFQNLQIFARSLQSLFSGGHFRVGHASSLAKFLEGLQSNLGVMLFLQCLAMVGSEAYALFRGTVMLCVLLAYLCGLERRSGSLRRASAY